MDRRDWIELAELAERHAPFLAGLLSQLTDTDAMLILDQLRAKDADTKVQT